MVSKTLKNFRCICYIIPELYLPIYQQLNPLKLNAIRRDVAVTSEYAERIIKKNNFLCYEGLKKLIYSYPSHSFVIDCDEAQKIFSNVRLITKPDEIKVSILFEEYYQSSIKDQTDVISLHFADKNLNPSDV